MKLYEPYVSVKVVDANDETITFFAARPDTATRNDFKLKVTGMRVKGKKIVSEGQQYLLPFGKKLLRGLKAPNAQGDDGFLDRDGKPMFCNPDTGEASHADWIDQVAKIRPDMIEAVANRMFNGTSIDVTGDAGDDDDAAAAGGESPLE